MYMTLLKSSLPLVLGWPPVSALAAAAAVAFIAERTHVW